MNKNKTVVLLIVTLLSTFEVFSQKTPFEISIEPFNITNLGGIQSYAFGQDKGKWLVLGGRLDGLHRREPWASFNKAGNNNQIIVIDPQTKQKWTAPLTSLPTGIQEQLSSSNMQFYQEGEYLYCVGGYGYSASLNNHTTYSNLTAIKVSSVINAVITNIAFTPFIRQITDQQFQVTGGKLKKINDTYYLLGGQKFIGRYNPMGPNHGPGFTQEYTNSIRKFNLIDNDTTLVVKHLTPEIDVANLHRRDYNAEPQILPNGKEGITMYSGVFQPLVDLPFLNSVTVSSNGYTVNNSFKQYYNHYHCPVLPIYSETGKEMHTVFFGGIAQYYDNDGTLVQDNNVPFVNTIARVTRDSNGKMSEYKLPVQMPALLGAGAEFIPNLDFPHFGNEVFKLDSFIADSILIGYIYGGISSTQPNIFFINDGTQSTANSQLFNVYLKKARPTNIDNINPSSTSDLNLNFYPNPNNGVLKISFNLSQKDDVTISIFDVKGVLIDKTILPNLEAGKNDYSMDMDHIKSGSIYLVSFQSSTENQTQKLILQK